MKVLRLALLTAFGLFAASPGVEFYPAKELQSLESALSLKGAPYADRELARFSNHYMLLIRRSRSGSAELHEREADVFIAQSGTATLVFGGAIVNPRATKAGEIRGASIRGGERHSILPGDVVHIPAGTPHQIVLDGERPFSYFVVKIAGQ